jgi:predicted  nucleic acid-binding Zn-ribbon protein
MKKWNAIYTIIVLFGVLHIHTKSFANNSDSLSRLCDQYLAEKEQVRLQLMRTEDKLYQVTQQLDECIKTGKVLYAGCDPAYCAALEDEKVRLKAEADKLKREITNLKNEIKTLNGKIQSLNSEIKKLKDEINTQKQEIEQKNRTITTLNEENDSLRREIDRLRGLLRDSRDSTIKVLADNETLSTFITQQMCRFYAEYKPSPLSKKLLKVELTGDKYLEKARKIKSLKLETRYVSAKELGDDVIVFFIQEKNNDSSQQWKYIPMRENEAKRVNYTKVFGGTEDIKLKLKKKKIYEYRFEFDGEILAAGSFQTR